MIKKKIARVALYLSIFLFAFFVFFVRGIDEKTIRIKLQKEAAGLTGLALTIGKLSVSPIGALRLEDIGIKDKGGASFHLENLSARIVWSSLLLASPRIRLFTETAEGYLRVDLSSSIFNLKNIGVRIDSKEFPIDKVVKSVNGKPLPFHAKIDSSGHFDFSPRTPQNSSGDLNISLSGFKPRKGAAGAFFLEAVKPQSASCQISVEKRMIKTKNCVAVTSVGKFDLRVASRIAKIPGRTPLSGSLVVTPSDKMLETILLGYSKYRKSDGAYYFPLRGRLNNPRLGL